LSFCGKCGYAVLSPEAIAIPKRPRREVVYLTVEEVQRFLAVIPTTTQRDKVHCRAEISRTGGSVTRSAMRIGEVLSIDRHQIDFVSREACVIGKGNKQRTVFFTSRALEWLECYLKVRNDDHPALFVCLSGRTRLKRDGIWRPFMRYRKLAGINKPGDASHAAPHAATQLLFNGCPVGHIKENPRA